MDQDGEKVEDDIGWSIARELQDWQADWSDVATLPVEEPEKEKDDHETKNNEETKEKDEKMVDEVLKKDEDEEEEEESTGIIPAAITFITTGLVAAFAYARKRCTSWKNQNAAQIQSKQLK